MADNKRATFTLAENSYNRSNDIRLVMNCTDQDPKLYITFHTRPEAFDTRSGSKNEVRDLLAQAVETRLANSGIHAEKRLADGYITLASQDKGLKSGIILYNGAEAIMKDVYRLTHKGVGLKAALTQVLDAEQAQAAGKPRPPVEVKMTLDMATAQKAIARAIERVMPRKEATAFSKTLATSITTRFPERPRVAHTRFGDPIQSRGTIEDPLFKAVSDACTKEAFPDPGKQHYATGEIFDALEAAYEGLGQSVNVPVRRRA